MRYEEKLINFHLYIKLLCYLRALTDHRRTIGWIPQTVGLAPLVHSWKSPVERSWYTYLLPAKTNSSKLVMFRKKEKKKYRLGTIHDDNSIKMKVGYLGAYFLGVSKPTSRNFKLW